MQPHENNGGSYSNVRMFFYVTPISDEHLLVMEFGQYNYIQVAGSDEAFAKLRESIMASTQLQLSGDALRQKAEVENELPNQTYSQSLPPYVYELQSSPYEQEVMKVFRGNMGNDYVNAMSETAYSKAIDKLMKEEANKYQAQVHQILQSHLRFKDNT